MPSSINKNGISIKIKTEVTGELIGEIDIPEGVARIPIRDLEELISDAMLMVWTVQRLSLIHI